MARTYNCKPMSQAMNETILENLNAGDTFTIGNETVTFMVTDKLDGPDHVFCIVLRTGQTWSVNRRLNVTMKGRYKD